MKVFEKFKSMGKRGFQEKKKERKRFHKVLKLEFVVRPLSPSSDKQTSNSSLQYHYSFKHTGPENKVNDHQNKMSGCLCEFSQVVP